MVGGFELPLKECEDDFVSFLNGLVDGTVLEMSMVGNVRSVYFCFLIYFCQFGSSIHDVPWINMGVNRVELTFLARILLFLRLFNRSLFFCFRSTTHFTRRVCSFFYLFFMLNAWTQLHTMLSIEYAIVFICSEATSISEVESIFHMHKAASAVLGALVEVSVCAGVRLVGVHRVRLAERSASAALLLLGQLGVILQVVRHLLSTDDLPEVRVRLALEEDLG